MTDSGSDLGILQALEEGRIDVQEAVRRLESEPESRPLRRRPPHTWWLIPLGAGMACLGGGGWLGAQGGWWWLVAVPLLFLGTLLTILAALSGSTSWVIMRVGGELRPRRISIPVPVRIAAWGVQIARPWVRGLDMTSLDELLLTLERELGSEHDLVIEVDNGGNGERVRVGFE